MRTLVRITLVALLAASPVSAQQLINGPSPGQVIDSVSIVIGMDIAEADRLLGSGRFQREPELEMPGLDASGHPVRTSGVFRRSDEPVHTGSIWLGVRDGRVISIGNTWKPVEGSNAEYVRELQVLLNLISSREAGGSNCQVAGGRTAVSNIQITCGHHEVLILRGLNGYPPTIGLNTK